MRSTTSFCSMKCWSTTRSATVARENSSGEEMLYGKLPTRRSGAGRLLQSNASASASMSVSCCGVNSPRKRAARSRSISIAVTCPARWTSGRVSAAWPGPISTIVCPGRGSIASTIRAMTRGSCRKFCPNRLRARCGAPLMLAAARPVRRPVRARHAGCRRRRCRARPGPARSRDRRTSARRAVRG